MRPFSDSLFAAPLLFSAIVHAATIDQPSNLLLTNPGSPGVSDGVPDASLSPNQTISKPLNTLPPSPFVYRTPDDPTATVTFSTYTQPIDTLSALECLITAIEDVQFALIDALRDRDPSAVVPLRYIRMDAQHAFLIIRPIQGQLRWTTCAQALRALRLFLNTWEFVGLNFDVEVQGVKVAEGVLGGR